MRTARLLHELLEGLGHAIGDHVTQRVVIYALTKRLPRRNEHIDLPMIMRVKRALTQLKSRGQSTRARGEV